MKLLRCSSKQCSKKAEPIMLPASLHYPKGEPAIAGRYVKDLKCSACHHVTFFSAEQYASMPDLSAEDWERLAVEYRAPKIAERFTKDFEGAGLTKDQAKDLYTAGFRGNEAEMEGR